MKRTLIIFLFIIFVNINSIGQDFSSGYYGFDGKIEFNGYSSVVIENRFQPEFNYTGSYQYREENKVPFISTEDKKILVLYSNHLLYSFIADDQGLVDGSTFGVKRNEFIMNANNASSSSYLIEAARSYPPENIIFPIPFMPWVENAEGYGIGEYISISWDGYDTGVSGIIFSNGFVAHSRPDLYVKNSRVKRIQIESVDGDFSFETEILDTPNPQHIRFPNEAEEIVITILDVYPGELWEDTCINFVQGISPHLDSLFWEK
jgi:hypothetical protein